MASVSVTAEVSTTTLSSGSSVRSAARALR